MKIHRLLGSAGMALFGLFLLGAPAQAQAQATESVTRVNVGDILRVEVEGRADISGNFAVDKAGSLTLPILGRVPTAGRTTSEISTDIARRMSLISSKITQVVVTITQVASKRNFVLGAVLLPGMYVFKEVPTVWEAIAEAGGPTDDADLTAVEVLSESQPQPTIVDVTSGASGTASNSTRLRPGDTVRVPRQTSGVVGDKDMIYVFGAVGSQGPQQLSLMPDLVTAFVRCVPSGDADFKRVEIVRRNGPQIVRMKVNMREYFDEGDIVGNPSLQAGDTVHFLRRKSPFSPLRIVGGLASIIGLAASISVLGR